MTAEPTYEYRVHCNHGEWFYASHQEAREMFYEAASYCDTGVSIQRRLITPWKDVPDDQ